MFTGRCWRYVATVQCANTKDCYSDPRKYKEKTKQKKEKEKEEEKCLKLVERLSPTAKRERKLQRLMLGKRTRV